MLHSLLEQSDTVESRCMVLSHEDPKKEQNLISYYQYSEHSKSVLCTMLKIAPGNEMEHVTNELFRKKLFTIDEIGRINIDTSAICKGYYYFAMSNNYLVTNQPLNRTIHSLQTYLRWFLNNELIEFTPVIDIKNEIKIKDISSIEVKEPTHSKKQKALKNKNEEPQNNNLPQTMGEKIISLPKLAADVLRNCMSEARSFSDIELSQLVSAKLLIKFKKKPKKMTDEDYASILGATLKPIAALDSISFKKANGATMVKGSELLRLKTAEIEVTESGKLVEQQIFQEMSRFIVELENEKNS
ncbi:conserved hypothetical protein [Xenorhabdus bovienii str. puntauvense]|uniref:Uncharacterized protein n=2 Tax=Xenorhabdus bovienii TaxID=40576 RepID=A0A077NM73_XENBV|nr:conserved hypothetical protein [Xenorhabdus bovienii str. puntauvense]